MEEEKLSPTLSDSKGINLLAKSKNCFFNILSYTYSRAEARILLNHLSKRGQKLCNDPELQILLPLTFNIEIRCANQISIL